VNQVAQEKQGKSNITLKVEDVMVQDIVTIDEKASVKEAAELMNQNEISCLIAVKNRKNVGIITERDLLKRVIVEAKNPNKTRVSEVMSSPVEAIAPDAELEEAVRIMFQKKIKKLPVIDNNRLVGLVSLTDIARCQPAIMKVLKAYAAAQNTPKSMKKIVDSYIV
jgi:CBS domain-containing protein